MRLTDDDYAALERRWITRALAQAARLTRLDPLEGRERAGRNGQPGNFASLELPLWLPGDPAIVGYRLRLDHPPIDAATGKALHKYLSPPGQRLRAYMVLNEPAWLKDATLPIVITEGEFKYLALYRAATEGAALTNGHGPGQPLFVPVAFAGCDGWHGRIGITTDANGMRVDLKGPIPDLDRFLWTGRKVIICFDSNAATNPNVRYARWRLARELEKRGAEVYFIDLPAGPGINGVDDYLAANGLQAFLKLYSTATRYDWHDELTRTDKGKILTSFSNALTALRLAPEWRGVLGFNEFALRVEARRTTPWGGKPEAWNDHGDLLTVEWLEKQGIRLGKIQAGDAVLTVAREHPFHPVREYLDGLKWDGVGRLDDWLTLYLGADPSDYVRAVGARWLIGAVARIYDPGCKADCMLILEGLQGIGKSTAFAILGSPFFTDDLPPITTKDAQLSTGGVWIIELAELAAMTHAEAEKIKTFLSRRSDRFRPPYARHPIEVPRQCVFGGTTNLDEYLKDETGNRRFWPVKCVRLNLEALRRDRDQLWAEAAVRCRKGERWWLDTSELTLAAEAEQEKRYEPHAWEGLLERWLNQQPEDALVTTEDALNHAIHKEAAHWTKYDTITIGRIFARLGWVIKKRPSGGTRRRLYGRKDEP